MTGFNLPPGVSVNDIPGNRPEDLAEEDWWDRLFQHPDIPSSYLPEEWWDDEGITKLVILVRDLAYSAGYAEGRADEALAEAARESESVDPQPQGASIVMEPQAAREFVGQCFRMRHVHPRWRQWLRIALREARGV